MDEVIAFGVVVLAVAGGLSLAVGASKLTQWFPVPAPAIFLLAAAGVSDVFPRIEQHVTIRTVERLGVVALIVILFDGGMHVGWRRFSGSATPITALGIVGTFATAGVMAVFAHVLLGFSWTIAGVIGAALSPTDPAVMFSVLGNKEVGGRTGTVLEGESGANDPVGIALMIGMLDLAQHPTASFWTVVVDFSTEMGIGLALGVAGGLVLIPLMRKVSLPREGLYPIRTLGAAGVIYGVASAAHGSGFLAVFLAGLIVGDQRVPYKAEIERVHTTLASLAEIAVFVALGLTIDLQNVFTSTHWRDGLLLAVLLALVARPLVVGLLALPMRFRPGERLFLMWGGLKGAVPILLATFVLLADVSQAQRIYDIVFIVVALSVLVQGSTIPFAAARLGVPMREVESEPWDLSIRLRTEPRGVQRFHVRSDSWADGTAIRDLPLSENAWISMVLRSGEVRQARGSYVLEPGDEVLVLGEAEDRRALRRVFEERLPRESATPPS